MSTNNVSTTATATATNAANWRGKIAEYLLVGLFVVLIICFVMLFGCAVKTVAMELLPQLVDVVKIVVMKLLPDMGMMLFTLIMLWLTIKCIELDKLTDEQLRQTFHNWLENLRTFLKNLQVELQQKADRGADGAGAGGCLNK